MSPSEPSPSPSGAELAAVVAAVEVLWPRPLAAPVAPATASPWRWSGRWWASGQPVAAERRRPGGR